MIRKLSILAMFLLIVPVVSAQTATKAKTTQTAKPAPAPLQWGPAPAVFPAGAQLAVVSGDPSKPGKFVIQLKMPDGYKIAPHFHPTEEAVTVKQGDFLVGMGDKFDAAKLKSVKPAGKMPATMHHFAQTKGETIVQVSAVGPFAMTYVNPSDDPSKK
jgi:hypothetical protein